MHHSQRRSTPANIRPRPRHAAAEYGLSVKNLGGKGGTAALSTAAATPPFPAQRQPQRSYRRPRSAGVATATAIWPHVGTWARESVGAQRRGLAQHSQQSMRHHQLWQAGFFQLPDGRWMTRHAGPANPAPDSRSSHQQQQLSAAAPALAMLASVERQAGSATTTRSSSYTTRRPRTSTSRPASQLEGLLLVDGAKAKGQRAGVGPGGATPVRIRASSSSSSSQSSLASQSSAVGGPAIAAPRVAAPRVGPPPTPEQTQQQTQVVEGVGSPATQGGGGGGGRGGGGGGGGGSPSSRVLMQLHTEEVSPAPTSKSAQRFNETTSSSALWQTQAATDDDR
jgi:hypothetical protein